jgi:plastocyanin
MRMPTAAVAAFACAATLIPGGVALATSSEPEVEMEDFSFRPARIVVGRGAVVVLKNRDRAPHNATALAKRNGRPLFKTRTVGFRGETTGRAPSARDTYRYLCTVHPRMRGAVVVR